MWVQFGDERETLQRVTGGLRSGWVYVEKIHWPHLGEERNRLQCDQWFHWLLSVSERAFSWGTL